MLDGEEQIVANAIQGRSSAFGRLYDHYQPKIYRFVLIKVGRREDAEDLTHQVFLSAWQSIKNYRHLGHPFSSWLYKIARNQIIDFYRTSKREQSLEEVSIERIEMVSPPVAQLAAEHALEFGRIQNAIQKLKPYYQDVIIMRFVEELSLKEVAAVLGKSEGAIKLMQHRAVKVLRKLIS